MIKKIIVFAAIFVSLFSARANDCAPLTYEQLSLYINKTISYDVWFKELIINGHPPDIQKSIAVWNKEFPDNPMRCIFKAPDIIAPIIVIDEPVKFREPYIWIGFVANEFRADLKEEANCHMSLCFLEHDKVIIISQLKPQKEDSSAILVQEYSYEMFYKITYLVFSVNTNKF